MDLDFLIVTIGAVEIFKIAPELVKRKFKVGILSGSPHFYNDDINDLEDIPYWHINDLIKRYENKIRYDKSTIERIKTDYNIPSLHTFYFPHFFYRVDYCDASDFYDLSNKSENELLFKKTLETFQAIEFFFRENNVKHTIQYLGGEILRRVLIHHNKKFDIPNIILDHSTLPGYFVILSKETGDWDEFVLEEYKDLNEKTINNGIRFINDFKSKGTIVKSSKKSDDKFINKVFNLRKHPNNIPVHLENYFKKCLLTLKYEKFYDEPDFNEKFIFFPLHYHAESRITLRDPHCWRQEFIVEYVARSLPEGYVLYVKPHPHWPLDFPLDGLNLISKISNVRLIRPNYNAIKLIKESEAVVVINSTSGIEALIYGKPVISFGTEFYMDDKITYNVKNLRKLPNVINRAISIGNDQNDKITFACAFLKANRLGNLSKLDEINIRLLVDGIMDYLEKFNL